MPSALEKVQTDGIYLIDNNEDIYIYILKDVSITNLQQVNIFLNQ